MKTFWMAVAIVLSLSPLPAQETQEKKLPELLEKLKAERIEERDAAAEQIVKLGEPALEALRKASKEESDAEARAQIQTIIGKIEHNAKVAKVCPPVKKVTLDLKDVALGDVVREACLQAGIEFDVAREVAERRVTLAAKSEPLLQVLDRACAALGDVAWTPAEGKVRVVSGKFKNQPRAYADGYRVTLSKVLLTEKSDFDKPVTHLALFFSFDAQPGVKARTMGPDGPARATAGGGEELNLKPAAMAQLGGITTGGGAPVYELDGLTVPLEFEAEFDGLCFAKDVPAGLKSLSKLSMKAKARFAIGSRSVKVSLAGAKPGSGIPLPELPFTVQVSTTNLIFMSADGKGLQPLADLIDTESLVVADKEGKEYKVAPLAVPGMRRVAIFQCEKDPSTLEGAELRLNVPLIVERDFTLEWRDIKLR